MRKLSLGLFHFVKRSAFLKLVIKIALTFAAFWVVFYEIDFNRLGEIVSRQDTSMLVITYILINIQTFIGGYRWGMIMPVLGGPGSASLTVRDSLRLTYIGLFFNLCLPGGTVGGDAVRVWLTKAQGVPLSVAIHSVVIDRIIALAGLGLFIWAGLPWIGEMAGFPGGLIAVLLIPVALVGLWCAYNIERLLKRVHHVPVIRQILHFFANIRALVKHYQVSIPAMVYSLIGHVLGCVASMYLARSLGIPLTFFNSLLLIPPVVLAAMLPISVGGWGIRELAMITMMGLIGVSQEEALIYSLETGLISIATGLPGGLLWLMDKKHAKASEILKETP